MALLLSVSSLCFAIVGMAFTYGSKWGEELKGRLFFAVAFSMPFYVVFIFLVLLHPALRNLRFHWFIKFLVQGLVYGTLAWFTDEIGEKHPEPYLVVASSAWAVHFGLAALKLNVHGDHGVTIGFLTVALVIAIHMTSSAAVKLGLMFGGGYLLAVVSLTHQVRNNQERKR